MGAVLLDTTVLIDLLRGRRGAASRLAALRRAGDAPHVCAINVEEVTRGLRERERDGADALIDAMRVAPLGTDEGRRAGRWRGDAAKQGRTRAQADCLIAAAAHSIGARLATGNPRDFDFPDLTVDHWPVGE